MTIYFVINLSEQRVLVIVYSWVFISINLLILEASQFPEEPSVYLVRIIERGGSPKSAKNKLEEMLRQAKWYELNRYVSSRLKRLPRIRECPLIHIGSIDSIRTRFRDLAGKDIQHSLQY